MLLYEFPSAVSCMKYELVFVVISMLEAHVLIMCEWKTFSGY